MQLPDGLNTLLGEGASKLSFGQEQLLSLARAIVTDPPLLLLDEMTSGLDALTEQKVLGSLRRMWNQKTSSQSAIVFPDFSMLTQSLSWNGETSWKVVRHKFWRERKAGMRVISVWRITDGKCNDMAMDSPSAFPEHLCDVFLRYGCNIRIVLHPLRKVLFHGLGPASVNLTRCVYILFKPLFAECIPQSNQFG